MDALTESASYMTVGEYMDKFQADVSALESAFGRLGRATEAQGVTLKASRDASPRRLCLGTSYRPFVAHCRVECKRERQIQSQTDRAKPDVGSFINPTPRLRSLDSLQGMAVLAVKLSDIERRGAIALHGAFATRRPAALRLDTHGNDLCGSGACFFAGLNALFFLLQRPSVAGGARDGEPPPTVEWYPLAEALSSASEPAQAMARPRFPRNRAERERNPTLFLGSRASL